MNTMYGVDIKLPPEGPPFLIEMNGVDFGTDFYKMPDHGKEYYDRAARELGKAANGKPLLLESEWCYPRQQRIVQSDASPRTPAKRGKDYNRLLPFERLWLDLYEQDEMAFDRECKPDGYPPEPTFYHNAAQQQGIDAYIFVKARRSGKEFEFDTVNRQWRLKRSPPAHWRQQIKTVTTRDIMRIMENTDDVWDSCTGHLRPDNIGAVWSKSESLRGLTDPLARPHAAFFNTPTLEFILDNKAALYACIDKAAWLSLHGTRGEYSARYPRTYVHVLGVSNPDALREEINEMPGKLVVAKPATGHCGIGTRILTKEQLLAEVGNVRRSQPVTDLHDATDLCYIVQEFVPSKPVRAKATGHLHDGCIRAVVVNGHYIGSQWRLAPKPIHASGALEAKYRCNLSRGAFPQYLSDKDEEAVARFAEDAIAAFERVVVPGLQNPFDNINLQLETPFLLSDEKTVAAAKRRLAPWHAFMQTVTKKQREQLRRKIVGDIAAKRAPSLEGF